MSPTYKEFREALYNYHIAGLDTMNQDPRRGKGEIMTALLELENMNNRRPNSFLMRVFFDAKAEEIEDIFSDGPSVDIVDLVDVLTKMAPTHAGKWRNINY
jgi:hypothetical protein